MSRRLVDVKGLADYLKISVHTVYQWVAIRKIPYIKIGNLLRFDLEIIDALIDRSMVEPNKEVSL